MKFIKTYVYGREDDLTKGLYVWEEEAGWLHIAKLPLDHDNIFFCKEEIEMVVGCKLVLLKEFDVDVDTEVDILK